jgi:enoyl-CoA hydratase/carnithine racemase
LKSVQKPVIACIHIGGGLDLITACDKRYCSSDGWFAIKEVDIGLAADIGLFRKFSSKRN